MLNNFCGSAREKMGGLMRRIFSSKPHFDFIATHYIWIIVTTIAGSVVLYGDGSWGLTYIDALLFASGSSTQGGLNPIDVNLLNTFQQITMYIFPMITNPIIIHTSVVILRLYWFEKRFQTVVKSAKRRRVPLSHTKSKAMGDDGVERAEAGIKVADIVRVHDENFSTRLANDGTIFKDDETDHVSKYRRKSDDSDRTLAQTKWRWHGGVAEPSEEGPATPLHHRQRQRGHDDDEDDNEKAADRDFHFTTPAITFTFADDPKTDEDSDGPASSGPLRQHVEHIAILERQRRLTTDDVLRIPTPQEAERGLGPQTIAFHQMGQEHGSARPRRSSLAPTLEPPAFGSRNTRRRATVTIAEPEPRESGKHDEMAEEAKGCGPQDSVQFRRPRFHHEGHQRLQHHDGFRKTSVAHDGGPAKAAFVPQRPPCAPRSKTLDTIRTAISGYEGEHEMPYLSYAPTVGRNSNFIGLSLEQREELGGIEYRSLKTLVYILLSYYFGFQILAAVFLLPFILHNTEYGRAVTDAGVGRPWWAIWTASGSFNDVGFALNPDSMIPFQSSTYILMFMSFFIIIGNAGFPVMLRFLIWVTSRLVPKGTGLWEELQFLLDHPRRCFTLLFPSNANWWLLIMLVLLNVIDVLFFIILDLNSDIVQDLPVGSRIANGLFMAASTRTAGFASLPLTELHPAMPVLYTIMMYIGAFPVAISIRRTNVYEEKSLGIYESGVYEDEFDVDQASTTPMSYVGNHLRRQLSFDLWFVSLGFFLLAITEGSKLKDGRFDMFSILFETISAYGTVGLSLGAPNVNASLCSQFSAVGKLIIVALQIRGRHRGLPYGLDRAVILPSESRFMSDSDLVPHEDFAHGVTTSASPPGMAGSAYHRHASMHSTRHVSAYNRRVSAYSHRRASMVSTRRRSSVAILGQLLHPGPSVPPGVVHSPRRPTRSYDMSSNAPRGARGWPSVSWHPPAVMEEDDEYDYDAITPLTPQSDHLRLAQTLSPTSTPSTSSPSTCSPPTR